MMEFGQNKGRLGNKINHPSQQFYINMWETIASLSIHFTNLK